MTGKSVWKLVWLHALISIMASGGKYTSHYGSLPNSNLLSCQQMVSSKSLSSTTRLYGLPAELIIQILDLLRPQDLLNFAFVHYSLLWSHRIVPAVSIKTINELLAEQQIPNIFTICPLPNEIIEQLLGYLDKQDIVRLMLAYYPTFRSQCYAPELSSQMLHELTYAASINWLISLAYHIRAC